MPILPHIKNLIGALSKTHGGKVAVDVLSVLFVIFSLVISTASLVGNSYNPFLYFRF